MGMSSYCTCYLPSALRCLVCYPPATRTFRAECEVVTNCHPICDREILFDAKNERDYWKRKYEDEARNACSALSKLIDVRVELGEAKKVIERQSETIKHYQG